MTAILVYMTASTHEEALRLSRLLIEKRLAACANILAPITSVYEWNGAVCEGSEVAFLAKTTESRLPELMNCVKIHHSYETPCIVALPLSGGEASFLSWIEKQVQEEK